MDNILILRKSDNKHLQNLEQVILILLKHGIKLTGTLSGRRQFLVTESPLKLVSTIFYQIFIFLTK